MLRILSILFISAGGVLLLYGGYQLWDSQAAEKERLEEAKSLISDESEPLEEEDYSTIYEQFATGDTIGLLYIPKLDREIPIIEGTEEEELAQGVGHYASTGFPGENKQILLSGHRDTVFRQFDELEHGDEFHIKMANGTFVYVIHDSEIVDADDRTVIDPSREDEYLTISTCYPFNFIGSAPDRYVLYAFPEV